MGTQAELEFLERNGKLGTGVAFCCRFVEG